MLRETNDVYPPRLFRQVAGPPSPPPQYGGRWRHFAPTAQAGPTGDQRPTERLRSLAPPEDWHESTDLEGYRVVIQEPGEGYKHIVTEVQVRDRLKLVQPSFLDQLEVVQLSRMTRKKQSFPCYGMQWGNAIYLYPLEDSLVEHFDQPPRPALMNEARMYGGVWSEPGPGVWTLTWSQQAAEDFYLNNILIHELGHLVDEKNSTYMERERYAEWFSIEHGYRASGGGAARRPNQVIRRRHHAK